MNVSKSTLLLGLLFFSINAIAAQASESSIKQLLIVTHAQKIIHRFQSQYRSLMNNTFQQELKGKTLTPRQKKIMENMTNAISDTLQEEISWEKLEPMYLRVYKQTFSEKEVDSTLAFFKTPAGQAYINKMPVLMHNFMVDYEKNIAPGLLRKLQKILKKYRAQLVSAGK